MQHIFNFIQFVTEAGSILGFFYELFPKYLTSNSVLASLGKGNSFIYFENPIPKYSPKVKHFKPISKAA